MKLSTYISTNLDSLIGRLSLLLCVILIIVDITVLNNLLILLTLLVLLAFLLLYTVKLAKGIDQKPFTNLILTIEHHIDVKILISIFFLISTVEVISFYLGGYTVQGYLLFFLYTIQAALIGLQIMRPNFTGSRIAIIFQVILLGLLIRLPLGLTSPSVIGIDPWVHEVFTQQIVQNGIIPSQDQYSGIPFFHLLIANGIMILGINYIQSSFILISTSQVIIIVLFTYLLGKRLVSAQIGLLASLVGIISNSSIFFGIELIPNTLGAILWLPIIYLLFFGKGVRIKAIILLFGLTIVLTHVLSSLGLFIVLISLIIVSLILDKISLGKFKTASLKFLGVFPIILGVLMFTVWTYLSFSLAQFASAIKIGFKADISFSYMDQFIPYAIKSTLVQEISGNIGRILFFTLALVGVLYCIRMRNLNRTLTVYSIGAIVPLLLGYFSVLGGLEIISGRWWYFSEILSTVVLVPFIILFAQQFSRNKWKFITILIVCILCFTMLISADVNVDSNETSQNTTSRYFFFDSEILSSKYVKANINDSIYVDGYHGLLFLPMFGFNPNDVGSIGNDLLINEKKTENGTWVLREEVKDHPVQFSGVDCRVQFNVFDYANSNANISKIYDCNTVFLYQ